MIAKPFYELAEVGYFGNWGGVTRAPSGSFLCGLEMRYEYKRSSDHTATNGFRYTFCDQYQWDRQTVRSFDGEEGEWLGVKMCPRGYYVNAFRAKVQDKQGSGDDTGLNDLEIRCHQPGTSNQKELRTGERLEQLKVQTQGTWREWKIAPAGYYPNGFHLRYEYSCSRCDDTAFNGFRLLFAKYRA